MSRRSRDVSICRIAEEAGVSAATVSRVIHGRVGVAESTRWIVRELLVKYGFAPEFPAMRPARIAVLLPYPHFLDYFRSALDGIYDAALRLELEVGILIAEPSNAAEPAQQEQRTRRGGGLLQRLRDQQYEGVIAIYPMGYNDGLAELARTELPVVTLDAQSGISGIGSIDNDSAGGAAEAARHLVELGHRNIGFLQRSGPSQNQRAREDAFLQQISNTGVTVEPHRVMHAAAEPEHRVRGMLGLRTMRRLLQAAPDTTAVMCVDDEVALGALTAIHEAGLRIPQDISIVGFDNIPETAVWHPALTTVDHPVARMGARAVELIGAGLKCPGSWSPPCEVWPTKLVVRNSTGPAPSSGRPLHSKL